MSCELTSEMLRLLGWEKHSSHWYHPLLLSLHGLKKQQAIEIELLTPMRRVLRKTRKESAVDNVNSPRVPILVDSDADQISITVPKMSLSQGFVPGFADSDRGLTVSIARGNLQNVRRTLTAISVVLAALDEAELNLPQFS